MSGTFSELPFSSEPSPANGPIQPTFLASGSVGFLATFPIPAAGEVAPTAVVPGGPSADDLLDLWKSVTDPGYHRPILEKPDGGGAFIQAAIAVHRSAAEAIDASTQSLYILPWSGQTSDPAHTSAIATGFLQVSRSPTPLFPATVPVVLVPDQFVVEHVALDWSPEGPVEVLSGRRYLFTQLAPIGPGALGPLLYPARAEKAGSSYNIPGHDTIVRPVQAGAGLNNVALSTSAPNSGTNWLVLAPAPDLLSEAQLGQYVLLTAPPSVAGQVRRLVAYLAPTDSSTGGTAALDTVGVFSVTGVLGNFVLGEDVVQASTGAHGRFLSLDGTHLALEQTSGTPFAPGAVLGTFSGSTATLASTDVACALPAAAFVSWVVLDWELDVGLSVTNPQPFSGGRLPVLEELGAERGVLRAAAEPEEPYRRRVANAADVVSPNALLRNANRTLTSYGRGACLREVGSSKLPGLFFDVPPDGNPRHAFAFDMDPVVRPGDRWKVLLSFTDMRAFFLMGVPRFGLGDFGLYADMDPGLDSSDSYLDGYAAVDASLHSAVYASLLRSKAGGVGFDLYVEDGGCI